ncbi:MAG: DUF5615 family PIN-like protein [Burkholderiales bacterium]
MTRLLLDQGLPRDAAAMLRQHGLDTQHVGELGLGAAQDREIVSYALREQRAIVTLDADFHAIVALSGQRAPSVLRIRQEGLRAAAAARLIKDVEATARDVIRIGALLTVSDRAIRVHTLPVIARNTSGK